MPTTRSGRRTGRFEEAVALINSYFDEHVRNQQRNERNDNDNSYEYNNDETVNTTTSEPRESRPYQDIATNAPRRHIYFPPKYREGDRSHRHRIDDEEDKDETVRTYRRRPGAR